MPHNYRRIENAPDLESAKKQMAKMLRDYLDTDGKVPGHVTYKIRIDADEHSDWRGVEHRSDNEILKSVSYNVERKICNRSGYPYLTAAIRRHGKQDTHSQFRVNYFN